MDDFEWEDVDLDEYYEHNERLRELERGSDEPHS